MGARPGAAGPMQTSLSAAPTHAARRGSERAASHVAEWHEHDFARAARALLRHATTRHAARARSGGRRPLRDVGRVAILFLRRAYRGAQKVRVSRRVSRVGQAQILSLPDFDPEWSGGLTRSCRSNSRSKTRSGRCRTCRRAYAEDLCAEIWGGKLGEGARQGVRGRRVSGATSAWACAPVGTFAPSR